MVFSDGKSTSSITVYLLTLKNKSVINAHYCDWFLMFFIIAARRKRCGQGRTKMVSRRWGHFGVGRRPLGQL